MSEGFISLDHTQLDLTPADEAGHANPNADNPNPPAPDPQEPPAAKRKSK